MVADYRLIGTEKLEESEYEIVAATHSACDGTYIVYAFDDGSHHKTPVVLWGVLKHGAAVPITLGGVWDGVANRNVFVLHPDGSCSNFESSWSCLGDAIAEMKAYDV